MSEDKSLVREGDCHYEVEVTYHSGFMIGVVWLVRDGKRVKQVGGTGVCHGRQELIRVAKSAAKRDRKQRDRDKPEVIRLDLDD